VATNLNDLFLALGIESWKPAVSALFVAVAVDRGGADRRGADVQTTSGGSSS
jgi:hypothetical protein